MHLLRMFSHIKYFYINNEFTQPSLANTCIEYRSNAPNIGKVI